MEDLECDCCSRDTTSGQDFLCVSCARSSIYLLRLENAKILLEKEGIGADIEKSALPIAEGSRSASHAQIAWQNEANNAEGIAIRGQIEEAKSRSQTLRNELELMRDEIAKRKSDLIDRRHSLDSISKFVPIRRETALSTVEEIRDKGANSFNNVNTRLVHMRAYLCRGTASLLRLRPRRRLKDGMVVEHHSITGILLPDLRDINTIRCVDLSAALNSVAHLLTQITFYLGVRLPSEITNQYRNYPLPTINTPAASYLGNKVPFPGSGSISTAPNSPFSSKHDFKATHRPRPLFIGSDDRDEKVAKFAKKDPSAFNYFVEGVALLAWNIAWLCRSQGFTTGTTSWEDICNMGKNLSTLVAQPQSAAMQRVLSDRDARKSKSQSPNRSGPSTPSTVARTLEDGRLASMSHHTFHPASLLTLPANLDSLKTWKLSKHQIIYDALKKHLLAEMNNAEWELLEEQEWNDGGEVFDGVGGKDVAVFVGAQRNDANLDNPSDAQQQDYIRTDKADDAPSEGTTATSKLKGGSGWTKVRGRDK